MKKILTIALAALVTAACSKNETTSTNQGNGIGFRSSMTVHSRATETTLTNLGEFNVTAIGNSANYFTDLSVTSADAGTTWTTGSIYYWPAYGLEFFAYAPVSEKDNVTVSSTAQTIDFTTNADVADQVDLVVAYNQGDEADYGSSGVPLNFKHALSQVEVLAKCSNDKIKIDVLGVRICQIPAEGTFTFPTAETAAGVALPQANWAVTADSEADYFMSKRSAALTLTATAQSIMGVEKNFMLIPHELTPWNGGTTADGAYLSVLCRISSLDGTVETLLYPLDGGVDAGAGKYGLAAVAIDTDWDPGKKYTYTLNFCAAGGGAGLIDPNIPVDDGDIAPDVDGDGGDAILNAPIFFTVTVDNWTPVAVTPTDME